MIANLDDAFHFGVVEWTVSARITSPDGRHIAVVRNSDGGATTSVGSFVDIEPKGERIFRADGAVKRDGSYGIDVRWRDAHTLEIAYDQAHWSEVMKTGDVKVLERAGRPPRR